MLVGQYYYFAVMFFNSFSIYLFLCVFIRLCVGLTQSAANMVLAT